MSEEAPKTEQPEMLCLGLKTKLGLVLHRIFSTGNFLPMQQPALQQNNQASDTGPASTHKAAALQLSVLKSIPTPQVVLVLSLLPLKQELPSGRSVLEDKTVLVHEVHYSSPSCFCKLFWGFRLVHKDSIFCFFTVQVSHEPGTGKIQVTHFFVQTDSMQQVCFKYFICQDDNLEQYSFMIKWDFILPY